MFIPLSRRGGRAQAPSPRERGFSEAFAHILRLSGCAETVPYDNREASGSREDVSDE